VVVVGEEVLELREVPVQQVPEQSVVPVVQV
jgi:hypothetical protein